jgi:hypothetical protein
VQGDVQLLQSTISTHAQTHSHGTTQPCCPFDYSREIFWQLLRNYMEPRIWAGYYGLNKFSI